MLTLHCKGGRYPARRPAIHDRQQIVASLEIRDGVMNVLIGDHHHLDRWEEFELPLDELFLFLETHRADREASRTTPGDVGGIHLCPCGQGNLEVPPVR